MSLRDNALSAVAGAGALLFLASPAGLGGLALTVGGALLLGSIGAMGASRHEESEKGFMVGAGLTGLICAGVLGGPLAVLGAAAMCAAFGVEERPRFWSGLAGATAVAAAGVALASSPAQLVKNAPAPTPSLAPHTAFAKTQPEMRAIQPSLTATAALRPIHYS